MTYWTLLYTEQSWREFLAAGGNITGFPERRWGSVQQIQVGDLLLCYLLGLSRYVGVLEATGAPFLGYKPIWSERLYPARISVKVRLELLPEYGLPVTALAGELSYFEDLGQSWGVHFRTSPILESPQDGQTIINALELASEDPTYRPLDRRETRPKVYETHAGVVTIPEDFQPEEKAASHAEIQWLLLKIGAEMGLDVWVARNDRGRVHLGETLGEMPRILADLPRQFDPATQRTIELIDVLWLKQNAILAAFEIEHTSAVYSGLLRMADLLTMQPNLNLQLYIVAPDERREKVFGEINRPVFVKLGVNRWCRYLAYSRLQAKAQQVWEVLRYLQPEFLQEVAETLEADL